ncbi:hypothetical protein BD779DRAFT_1537197, partial [Infundibulicybe gibba]
MLSPPLPVSIASLGLEGMLYGVFFTLFILYFALRPRGAHPRMILYSSLFCFSIVSVHWLLSITRFVRGYALYRSGAAPADFSTDVIRALEVAKESLYVVLLITGDLTMIFRLWAAWNKDQRVVIFPIIMLVPQCAFAVNFVLESNANWVRSDGSYAAATEPGLIGLGVTTLCINVYTTVLISYRIWRMEQSNGTMGLGFRFIITLLIESWALNSAWELAFIICNGEGSQAAYVLSDALAPITGIAFMLVNVRVDIHRVREQHAMKEVP